MNGIVIFGTMGSGKDSLAEMLVENISNAKIYKLGEDIRGIVDTAGTPDRALYQEYGQMVREVLGQDAWNNICLKKIEADRLVQKFNFPVIADGRQINEYTYWQSHGFYVVGIEAPIEVRRDRLVDRDGRCDVERMTHDTELQAQFVTTQLADHKVRNTANLRYLECRAAEIADKVNGGI